MGKTELKLEIDADLLARAEAAGIPLARVLEAELRHALEMASKYSLVEAARRIAADPEGAAARAKQWAEENAEAIESYRRRIDEFGVFGEDLRRW
jgi:post-segregation antitoxin (ccd killing protein)